ncbi:hypothetical protein BJ742DRAFT_858448 [Cladochytrium replicatum]|nr:hypothetical protein BJ742DRAFT_858448 [Cladochytrium replicatum]
MVTLFSSVPTTCELQIALPTHLRHQPPHAPLSRLVPELVGNDKEALGGGQHPRDHTEIFVFNPRQKFARPMESQRRPPTPGHWWAGDAPANGPTSVPLTTSTMIPANRENVLPDAHYRTQRQSQFVDYNNDTSSQFQSLAHAPPSESYSPSIGTGGHASPVFSTRQNRSTSLGTSSRPTDMMPSASGVSTSFSQESLSSTPRQKQPKKDERTEERDQLDSPPSSAPSRRSVKSHVSRACLNCRRSHLACDQSRPCKRCVQTGKAALCTDLDHKRRGRPKLAGRSGTTRNHGKSSSAVPTASSSSSSPVSSGEMELEHRQASPRRNNPDSPMALSRPGSLSTTSAPQNWSKPSGTALASLLAQPPQPLASFLPSPTSTNTSTPNMIARPFPSPNFPRSDHPQQPPQYNLPTPTSLPSSFEPIRTTLQQHTLPTPSEVVFHLTHDLTFSRLLHGDPRMLLSVDANLLIGRSLPSIVHDADRSLLNAVVRGSPQHLHVLPPFCRTAPVLVTVSIEPVSHPRPHEVYVCQVKKFQHGVLTAHEMRQQRSGSAQQHQQQQLQHVGGQQKQWNPVSALEQHQGRGLPGFSR